MKGIKIYYLEDEKDTFSILKDELNSNGFIVFPKTLKQWSLDLMAIKNYLKSNEEEKAILMPDIIAIFKSADVDLFIFDYYIIETDYRSTTIYNEILQKNSVLTNIPLIFLTVEDNTELMPIENNTGFVLKKSLLSEENANETVSELIKEIEKFPILLDKMTSAEDLKTSNINWIRKNF